MLACFPLAIGWSSRSNTRAEVFVPGKSDSPCFTNHRCDPFVQRSRCARSRDGERDDAELAWWDFLLAVQAVRRQSRVDLALLGHCWSRGRIVTDSGETKNERK